MKCYYPLKIRYLPADLALFPDLSCFIIRAEYFVQLNRYTTKQSMYIAAILCRKV